MTPSTTQRAGSLALSAILALSPLLSTGALAATPDTTPPKVQHEPADNDAPDDQPLQIYATVTDENGVSEVTLFYRNAGEDEYRSQSMQASGNSGIFMAEVPPAELQPPRLEYYIQAGDTGGNQLLRGFYFEPLSVNVVAGTGAAGAVAAKGDESAATGSLKSNKWLWIGLGAVALGGLAAAGGGGGGGGDSGDNVDVSVPLPQ
ncbi:hypothetical protein Q4485_05865 [Granulosicoccaceae sp. 1_MG-2023]|nr:hypothetical protein [Granulosicoccaceae sp. 1_MG-2023]